jgi:hypothetical protein
MFCIAYYPALVRSVIWFPVFALFLGVRWTGSSRTLALTAGIAVLLLNLCLSGGISIPAVAQPLWIVAAIALASDAPPKAGQERASLLGFAIRFLPVPILGVLALIYWTMFLEPVAEGAKLVRLALRAENYLAVLNNPNIEGVPENVRAEIRRNPRAFVDQAVLRPLQRAAEASPGDSRHPSSLANWTGVLWQLVRDDPRYSDPIRNEARNYALKCREMDPFNREGYMAEATLEEMFGSDFMRRSWQPTLAVSVPWGPFPQMLPVQPLGGFVALYEAPSVTPASKTARLEFEQAATALRHAVELSPTQPFVRFRYMGALISAGHTKEAERQANELLVRDRAATHKSRKLTDPQREQVSRWLQTRPNK